MFFGTGIFFMHFLFEKMSNLCIINCHLITIQII